MHPKHKGAHSEMVAAAWLLSHGYEVFRNVSDRGLIDMIGRKDDVSNLFDVKSSSNSPLSEEQIKIGVRPIYVQPDGSCSIDDNPKMKDSTKDLRVCPYCEFPFKPKRAAQVYCGKVCENGARWN